MLPLSDLEKIAIDKRSEYQTSLPFKHCVLDNVFDPELLEIIIREFDIGEKRWKEFDTRYERKMQMNSDEMLEPTTRAFIHNLNSGAFVKFLTSLTGIDGLIPDPYLGGAGLHKIERGGKLGVHVDFSGHETMGVYRRLNVLVYLNKNWKKEWGGDFQLWDRDKQVCRKKIFPIFNRMVIFNTTSDSFHGHPEPLACPKGFRRISLALYYYTAKPAVEGQNDLTGTLFLNKRGKPEELLGGGRISRIKQRVFAFFTSD